MPDDRINSADTLDRVTRLEVGLELKLQSMSEKLDTIMISQQRDLEELQATRKAITTLEADFSNLEKAQLETRLSKVEKSFAAMAATATAVSAFVSLVVGWLISVFK